jgi:phage protein D
MTETLLKSSAPVFKVNGEVRGELARDLSLLEIEETTDGLRSCVARFIAIGPRQGRVDEGLLYLDGQSVDFGQQLEVAIGPSDDERIVFKGLISAIEARFEEARTPQVVLFAEDKLMKLRMTRRSRTYENKSDAEIAKAIAQEHGFDADADASGPSYDVVQQWNQSDLAFLRARARLIQAELWFQDGKIFFKSRGSRTGTNLTLVAGNQLLSARIRADLAHQRTKVKVSGYDAQGRGVIDEEAGADAVQSEVSDGRTGPDVLSQAFGERASYRVREAPLTDDEASQWARAEMLRRARGFVHVEGLTSGSPDMIVGSKLELQRVGAPFSGGGYYVTRVCHRYDLEVGHRTAFEAERPTLNSSGSEE